MRKFNKSGTRGRFFKMKCPFYLNIFQNEEIDNQLLVLFLLLREATFLPTAEKRNDKKSNFASENLTNLIV